MNTYTCGPSIRADSPAHAMDKLTTFQGLKALITQTEPEIICTSQENWEPSIGLWVGFFALCLGIALGARAKRT